VLEGVLEQLQNGDGVGPLKDFFFVQRQQGNGEAEEQLGPF
jgi:hypothetical protein